MKRRWSDKLYFKLSGYGIIAISLVISYYAGFTKDPYGFAVALLVFGLGDWLKNEKR